MNEIRLMNAVALEPGTIVSNKPMIHTWREFVYLVRGRNVRLLGRLEDFDNPVLVAGCQRSGTTAVARLITSSAGMTEYWFGRDDELDAALILSGYVPHEARGRYCFQTTYLNESYPEYFDHVGKYKLVWIVRNPYSVIYSMLKNWGRFAFNELFDACGAGLADTQELARYRRYGKLAISRVRRACLAYNGKSSQLFEILERLGPQNVAVIEYDELTRNKTEILPQLYRFLDIEYAECYGDKIHASSLDKASKLSAKDRAVIADLCLPVYERAKALVMIA